ncbi:MAG: protein YgfX [Methylophilaceae bacterium]
MKLIALDLTPSYYMVAILAIASFLAASVVMFMPLHILLKLFVLGLVVAATIFHIMRDALLVLPQSPQKIEVNNRNALYISDKSGNRYAAAILSSSFVASYLTILNLKISGKFWSRSIILMPDSASSAEFRQLRVWLKWSDQEALDDVPDEA